MINELKKRVMVLIYKRVESDQIKNLLNCWLSRQ